MFGFFKPKFTEIGALKYQMLAVSVTGTALGVTMNVLPQSSRREGPVVVLLYNEVLAFAVCLAQMRIQKKYKVNDGHEGLTIINTLLSQIRDLPVPDGDFLGLDGARIRAMLDETTSDAFFEVLSCYVARDYKALGINDNSIAAFCGITRQMPSVIKGAGWTMALLMFQIRTAGLLFEDESEISQGLLPMLNAAREGCQVMMDQFDHVLDQ